MFSELFDPLAGSGWAGAGLLGMVLAWLMMKHLPDKDRQLERLMADHKEALKETRADFRAALTQVLEHCKEELGSIVRRQE